MMKDLIYFNRMEPVDIGGEDECYRIPFSMSPATEDQVNDEVIIPVRQRIRKVLVDNGYVLIAVYWATQHLVARKRKVFTGTYNVP